MKQLTVRDFGTLKNGEKAHLYIMENENGGGDGLRRGSGEPPYTG